jgi:hypothetical protein
MSRLETGMKSVAHRVEAVGGTLQCQARDGAGRDQVGPTLVDLQFEAADGALPVGGGLEDVLDVVVPDREIG